MITDSTAQTKDSRYSPLSLCVPERRTLMEHPPLHTYTTYMHTYIHTYTRARADINLFRPPKLNHEINQTNRSLKTQVVRVLIGFIWIRMA
jgi:hypothetical protein